MYYIDALKNSLDSKFQKIENFCPRPHLKQVVPDYFSNTDPGVHFLAICTSQGDISDLDENDLANHLTKDTAYKCEKLREINLNANRAQRCCVIDSSQSYRDALEKISKWVERCYCSLDNPLHEYVEDQLIENSSLFSSQIVPALKIFLGNMLAEARNQNRFHSLFIVLTLPKDLFSEFEDPDHFFPAFFEYVVLSESDDKIYDGYKKHKEEISERSIKEYERETNQETGQMADQQNAQENALFSTTQMFESEEHLNETVKQKLRNDLDQPLYTIRPKDKKPQKDNPPEPTRDDNMER